LQWFLKQAAIRPDNSSHASNVTKTVPLSSAIPKKPSKREAKTSDQMDSGRTLQEEKRSLHHDVLWNKVRLMSEKPSADAHDKSFLSLILIRPIWREGQIL